MLDAAYTDGFDVANMSLGGGAHGIQDLLTIAVDNLDQANMVSAVAAETGRGHYTVESPGSAARALTAGVATRSATSSPVRSPSTAYRCRASPAIRRLVASDFTAPLGVVTEAPTNSATGLSTACGPLAANLTGQIA